jgi:hypothetical protein
VKLRLHSEKTLDILDNQTQTLGQDFHLFQDNTCAAFDTKERKREAGKRYRGEVKNGNSVTSTARKSKKFSLNTYKYHCLGDYVENIHTYGATDSYSTESVRLCFFRIPFSI